jgi:uncharacterized protein
MILEFSVGNFLSFSKRVTLSFMASSDRTHPSSVIAVPGSSGPGVLRALAVYGANGSGKSNLVAALKFVEMFVRTSADEAQSGKPIGVTPFRLDPAREAEPSEFEVVVALGEERYVYGFTADATRVHEEWLTACRKRVRLLFRRGPKGELEFGNSWRGDKAYLLSQSQQRPKALVLSLAGQLGNPSAWPVYYWFVSKLWPVWDTFARRSEVSDTTKMILKSPDSLKTVEAFLRAADLGIDSLAVRPARISESDYWRQLSLRSPDLYRSLLDDLVRMASETPSGGSPDEFITVAALHRRTDGKEVAFSFDDEESDGTRQIYALAAPWKQALDEGHVVVMDELHAKLHPLISRFLIEAFQQHAGEAQVVFTTHDCSLLDPAFLRRDQVWFTEKDETGATDLYSLWDYRPRRDENIRGWYLRGKYGAVPFVGELSL